VTELCPSPFPRTRARVSPGAISRADLPHGHQLLHVTLRKGHTEIVDPYHGCSDIVHFLGIEWHHAAASPLKPAADYQRQHDKGGKPSQGACRLEGCLSNQARGDGEAAGQAKPRSPAGQGNNPPVRINGKEGQGRDHRRRQNIAGTFDDAIVRTSGAGPARTYSRFLHPQEPGPHNIDQRHPGKPAT